MKIIHTYFKEVFLFRPELYKDTRGSFTEAFKQNTFEKIVGRKIDFCQDNCTTSRKGVIRGLHYQLPPFSQSKLVSVIQGKVLDVVVDIRKGSPTFGRHFTQELSAGNKLQLFIPRGFAHGYITISEDSIFMYKVDNYYQPNSEGGIAVDDPEVDIDWLIPKRDWIQSDKDLNHPQIKEAILFNYNDNLYV